MMLHYFKHNEIYKHYWNVLEHAECRYDARNNYRSLTETHERFPLQY